MTWPPAPKRRAAKTERSISGLFQKVAKSEHVVIEVEEKSGDLY